MNIFINSYALQFQQSHQLALVAQIYAAARMHSWTSTLGTGDSPQPHIPLWDIQASGRCKTMGFSAYPYLSDSERRQIAIEQGIITNIPITSAEDRDTLPEMIRIPISGNEESADDNGSQAACEQEEEAAIPAIEEDKENPESPPQIDVCFASAAEVEAQPSEVVVLEIVEAATAQPHTSVHRTGDLVWALKKVSVPTMRQKSGFVNAKIALVHTAAPKRPRSNGAQPPLVPNHKSAIKIAPSTSTEQVRIPHAWEAALPATPKKERFHARPKKLQTHSVTQASGRQNISGDVRNHPDLISTVKKNRHNTNRDGQPKIGPIKQR
ncbi:hypothetical protein BASA50_006209 [Batrachochytrium salamandrivorans]|uniref:Uncharacterized protein n=1 Tax=Batrachochytrium salamandrivorans TaxID=1357716 RepID=A0ABQ8FAP0_9FUNG|nr:hypothetical protein BASA50_006209 [Batrachochytrium salamandrivorans]